jgi:hypothetical protein
MKPLIQGVTVFAFASAAIAFVPSNSYGPRGDVNVVSFGIATISADDGEPIPTLHVRETLSNRSDKVAWTAELAGTSVSYGDASPSVHPLFINSDAQTLPIAVIGRAQRRVVDLYFPTPKGITEDEALPVFAFAYRVNTPDHRVDAHAMFAPSKRWLRPDERTPEPGWARNWWADPAYSWSTYRHQAGHAVPRPPRKFEIIHVPRALYEEMPSAVPEEEWPRVSECDEW